MSAGFSQNQRSTGGHRPPLQQRKPLCGSFATPSAEALVLVTCYPFYYIGPAPKRFIVEAVKN